MIAKIAVSAAIFAIDKPYSYRIPESLQLVPGVRVLVPFGRGNRRSEGIVLRLEEGDEKNLKSVECCLDEEPVLTDEMLRLAAFMRDRYFCSFYDAARAMLPSGLWFQAKDVFMLTEEGRQQTAVPRQKDAEALLNLLKEQKNGRAEGKLLREAVPDEERFDRAVSYLLKKKWAASETSYHRKTRDGTEQVAVLAVVPEEAKAYLARLPKRAAMQRAVLELMCSVGMAAAKEICYFTGASMATLRRLEELRLIQLFTRPVLRCREIKPVPLDGPLVLNPRQQEAYEGLLKQMTGNQPGIALLYGVTGSGKTAVYLKLIEKCLEQGRSAMFLVPEIGLTPQLLGLLTAYFGSRVAVLHSSLGENERYDQWKRVRSGDARVVVGTRSAVFAPCRNLGLLILDEEQEHSYKSEQTPRYAAREIAIWRGDREKAMVLFGSATPSVETMYRAQCGDYRLYTLTDRFNGKPLPRVDIVDMREQLKDGNELSVSYPLMDAIRETADAGKQTILFLNRRGNSRALVCVQCRETPKCPRCNAKLVYHSANRRMMCHHCGLSEPVPDRCPVCGGPLKTVGTGTQKVQQELQSVFPDLEIARMDTDTVSAVNTHEQILEKFRKEHIPILLGTQMVAKGLNFPDVTLVGVLDADLSIHVDNFRAAETTFNMVTQVVGRAGRGDTPGRAIIQTMVPDNQVIRLAAMQDYDGFYDLEIQLRRMLAFPPFGDLIQITFSGEQEGEVLRCAEQFREVLDHSLHNAAYEQVTCRILGPAPCPVPKINYHYRYWLTISCHADKKLRELIAYLLRRFSADSQNRGVAAFADVNGYD